MREFKSSAFTALGLYVLVNTILFHFVDISRYMLINFFLGYTLIFVLSENLELNFELFGKFFGLFSAINLIFISFQMTGIDPVFSSVSPQNMPQTDVVGLMGLKANLGMLAAISFPFLWISKKWTTVIVLPLLWYSKSSTAVLAVLISFMIWLWSHSRKRVFFSLMAILCLGALAYIILYDFPTGEFFKRFRVWGAGIHYLATSSPWFGNGLGSWAIKQFSMVQDNGVNQVWIWAHNEFVQFMFETGVIGFLILMWYLKNVLKSNDFRVMFIASPILFMSFFHFPFHLGRFAGLFCFIFSVIHVLQKKSITENLEEQSCENFYLQESYR